MQCQKNYATRKSTLPIKPSIVLLHTLLGFESVALTRRSQIGKPPHSVNCKICDV